MFNILCLNKSKRVVTLEKFFLCCGIDFCTTECYDYKNLSTIFCLTKNSNTVIVCNDSCRVKTIVKDAFDLKSVVNSVVKKNYDLYVNNTLDGIGKSFDFECCLLPCGFLPMREDRYTTSFFGKVGQDNWCFFVGDNDEDIQQFKVIVHKEGLINEPTHNYCYKLFDLKTEDILTSMAQFDYEEMSYIIKDCLCGDVALYVFFKEKTPILTIDIIAKSIYAMFGDNIYADFDASLEEVAVHLATLAGTTVSFAESLTGGMLAERLVNVPNASKVLECSFVTYSNYFKTQLLGVKTDTLKSFGAVSEEVALEMARGLLSKTNAGVAVSTTGIAGPSGGSLKKPVGLVYTCIAKESYAEVFRNVFEGDRNEVRQKTTNFAFFNLIKALKNF